MDEAYRKLSALVIGAGSIGRCHAGNLLALGVGSVAVCDTDPSRLEAILPDQPVERFVSPEEALLRGGWDAVFVCTPPALHVPYILSALAGGADVFTEKPVAANLTSIPEIAAEKKRAGRMLQAGYNLAYHPGLRLVRDILEAGVIGTPIWARAEFGQYLPDWRPWQDYRQSYTARRELGGGIILDASHEIHYLCELFGDVNDVHCLTSNLCGLDVDVEESALISLRFSSGVLGVAQLDMVQRVYSRSCKVVGSQGTVEWDYPTNSVRLWTAQRKEWEIRTYEFEPNEMYVSEVAEFLDRAAGKSPRTDNFEAAVRALKVAMAAREIGRDAADDNAMNIDLTGKTALVTAASRGLGAEIAQSLAKSGAAVVITYKSDKKSADALVKSIESAGGRCRAIQADAADHTRALEVAADVLAVEGKLDILICNAGVASRHAIWKLDEAEWDNAVDIGLKGAYNYIRAASPAFRDQNSGKIVCIGSINGLRGRIGGAAYNAAKAGLVGLVKTVAAELGPHNVNVNLVAPGYIETAGQAETPELIRDLVIKECAIKRLGTPEDIAAPVVFLCSEAARHITGQTIKVDAGQYL